MNEFSVMAVPLLAGLMLGVLFFGGLWLTVSRGMASRQPALWFFGSQVLRMGVTLLGFYLVAREDWRRWLLCVLGFVLARLIVQSLARSPQVSNAP